MPLTDLCGLVVVVDPQRPYQEDPLHIPVPLTKVHIDARVVNFVAQVRKENEIKRI